MRFFLNRKRKTFATELEEERINDVRVPPAPDRNKKIKKRRQICSELYSNFTTGKRHSDLSNLNTAIKMKNKNLKQPIIRCLT